MNKHRKDKHSDCHAPILVPINSSVQKEEMRYCSQYILGHVEEHEDCANAGFEYVDAAFIEQRLPFVQLATVIRILPSFWKYDGCEEVVNRIFCNSNCLDLTASIPIHYLHLVLNLLYGSLLKLDLTITTGSASKLNWETFIRFDALGHLTISEDGITYEHSVMHHVVLAIAGQSLRQLWIDLPCDAIPVLAYVMASETLVNLETLGVRAHIANNNDPSYQLRNRINMMKYVTRTSPEGFQLTEEMEHQTHAQELDYVEPTENMTAIYKIISLLGVKFQNRGLGRLELHGFELSRADLCRLFGFQIEQSSFREKGYMFDEEFVTNLNGDDDPSSIGRSVLRLNKDDVAKYLGFKLIELDIRQLRNYELKATELGRPIYAGEYDRTAKSTIDFVSISRKRKPEAGDAVIEFAAPARIDRIAFRNCTFVGTDPSSDRLPWSSSIRGQKMIIDSCTIKNTESL